MIIESEIVEIVECEEEDTIDIEVSGNHLFFANGILTHNSAYDSSDVDLTNTSECIFIKEKVQKKDGDVVEIQSLKPGDKILSDDGSKLVTMVHHPKQKDCVQIKTKSGKTITVSKDHVFPVKDKNGNVKRISYNQGLRSGFFVNTK